MSEGLYYVKKWIALFVQIQTFQSVPGCFQLLVLHGQSIIIPCTMSFYFWFWRTLAYLPCTSLFSTTLLVFCLLVLCLIHNSGTLSHPSLHLLQVCLVFVNGGRECSTCKFLRNLQSGLILLFSLFYIPLLIVPNSLTCFSGCHLWLIWHFYRISCFNFKFPLWCGNLCFRPHHCVFKAKLFFKSAPFLHWLTKSSVAH